MRPILLLLALVTLTLAACSCASHADAPLPVAPEQSWTLDAPIAAYVAPAAACQSRSCAVPQAAAKPTATRLKSGQPLRNAARIAAAPIRALRAAKPLRRAARAVGRFCR
jgi:protein-disulfide isomerase